MSLLSRTTYKGVAFQTFEVAVFAIVAMVTIAAGWYAHGKEESLVLQAADQKRVLENAENEIREIRETQGITEKKVADIQGHQHSVESRLLTGEAWEKFVKSLGKSWRFRMASRSEDKDGLYATMRGELSFLEQSVAEAQVVLDTLSKTEALSPMLGIERVTITTDGDATSRQFSVVQVAVAVPLRTSK